MRGRKRIIRDLQAEGLLAMMDRVQVSVADYLESGQHLGIQLRTIEILSAIDAAIADSEGHPSPAPDGADARTFFLHGLYEEIIQQPNHCFELRRFEDGSTGYLPLDRERWRSCLRHLQALIRNAEF